MREGGAARFVYDGAMPCPSCGNAMTSGAFCSVCGANVVAGGVAPMGMGGMPMRQRTSGMAIAGFVLSFFCGLLGLIFSILGRNECKRSNGTVGGEGLALAGIIISILQVVGAVLYTVVIIAFARDVKNEMEKVQERQVHAEQARDQAVDAAKQAQEALERAVDEVTTLDAQVKAAEDEVEGAKTDGERTAANARLGKLQKQLEDAQQRVVEESAKAARTQRLEGIHIDQRCIDNPLAKGCQ
jgi:hypothetical protein